MSKVIEITKEKMSRQTAKKSLSNSPLYRSTIDHIVREDNVQSVTEDLKVILSSIFGQSKLES